MAAADELADTTLALSVLPGRGALVVVCLFKQLFGFVPELGQLESLVIH
jgi:hypothetical protein